MSERYYSLDVVRAVAIVLVVFTHCHELAGLDSIFLKSFFYSLDRLGVPLFFMLTGGLVLPKLASFNHTDILLFYRKKIFKFIFILVFYSIVINTISALLHDQNLFQALKKSAVEFNGIFPSDTGVAVHLWFLYTIIQIYLIAPFVAKFLKILKQDEMKLYLFILIGLIFISPILNILLQQFQLHSDFLLRLGQDFLGGYIVYLILGYMIIYKKIGLSTAKIKLFLLLIVPIVILLAVELVSHQFYDVLHWYSSSLFILVSSVALIILIIHYHQNTKPCWLVTKLSQLSYGIFLNHIIFIMMVQFVLNVFIESYDLNFSPLFKTIVFFLVSFICSFICTELMRKNHFFKKLIS